MRKYNAELKHSALEMAQKDGFKKASVEYEIPETTLRRWNRAQKETDCSEERKGIPAMQLDEMDDAQLELDEEIDDCLDGPVESEKERQDVVPTAMAFLVIENMRLRDVNRQLRNTINRMKGNNT